MSNRFRMVFSMGIVAALAVPTVTFAQFPEPFDGTAGLPVNWVSVNNSPGPVGTNPNWNQTDGVQTFPPHAGAGFVAANYNSSSGANTISNYLMSPMVTIENGAIIRFWTKSISSTFPDRMILTYSTNGVSTAPADFANLANLNFHVLQSINPNLVVGGYPANWTQFTVTLSGIAAPTQGRFAFWYYVTNAGPAGVNSDYIGVDDVEFVPFGVTTGRCCNLNGTCSATTAAGCAAPSVFGGVGSSCNGTPCQGRCCHPDGTCTLEGQTTCVAPNTYGGVGTICSANADECKGRCCDLDGFCTMQGSTNCVGAGMVFGGVGTICSEFGEECRGRCCAASGDCLGDQSSNSCTGSGNAYGGNGSTCDGNQCKGRCCLTGSGICVPESNPNSCLIAGGAYTASQDCSVYTVSTFTTGGVGPSTGPLPLSIPDAPSDVQNVQTVSGFVGTIADLNVDVKIDHTYMGDIGVRLEFNSTTVDLITQLDPNNPGGFGCDTPNIDVVLDDEAPAGSINNQCNATPPAAQSPPSFVPTQLLSAFDGMNPNGNWTIHVTDGATPDTGSLIRWSLHIGKTAGANVVCAPACACKGDMNGSGTVNGADINKFAQCVAAGGGAGCACADVNGGGITPADITPFVNALIAGTACIP